MQQGSIAGALEQCKVGLRGGGAGAEARNSQLAKPHPHLQVALGLAGAVQARLHLTRLLHWPVLQHQRQQAIGAAVRLPQELQARRGVAQAVRLAALHAPLHQADHGAPVLQQVLRALWQGLQHGVAEGLAEQRRQRPAPRACALLSLCRLPQGEAALQLGEREQARQAILVVGARPSGSSGRGWSRGGRGGHGKFYERGLLRLSSTL